MIKSRGMALVGHVEFMRQMGIFLRFSQITLRKENIRIFGRLGSDERINYLYLTEVSEGDWIELARDVI
jgi:hypothetical protein